MFRLNVDEHASEQQHEDVVSLLLGEHALRILLGLQRQANEVVCGPVHRGDVDDVADDVNARAGDSVDLVGLGLDEFEGLRLVEVDVVGHGVLSGEKRMQDKRPVLLVPVRASSESC